MIIGFFAGVIFTLFMMVEPIVKTYKKITNEAIEKGYAEWFVNSSGEKSFEWKK